MRRHSHAASDAGGEIDPGVVLEDEGDAEQRAGGERPLSWPRAARATEEQQEVRR